MTDHQKVLLELTKTVQLQTKLLEAQIKQCLPPSSTDVSTTTCTSKIGSDMKHRTKCGVLSAHCTSSTGSSSGGIGTSKQMRKKSVLEYPKNNVMTTVPIKHALQSEPASPTSCHKSASEKHSLNELDLSVDSGIVPEMSSSNDNHGHGVQKEEGVFLDKNGNITTRKIECAKTVAKVESWLKGILTPTDRDCKAKQKKVTFEEPKSPLNGKSDNECTGESGDESQEENRADSTTELCTDDNETDKNVSEAENTASDGGTFLGTSLPYPFPTLSSEGNGIEIPDMSLDFASPSTVSGSDTCPCDTTKGMSNSRPWFDGKKFPCPINWQTFLRGPSAVKLDGTIRGPTMSFQSNAYNFADSVYMKGINKHNSNINILGGNVSMAAYPRLAPPICPTPVFPPPLPPVSRLPLSPFFQPPLPPEEKPPPPPPPDHSPEEKIKRRKQKSSKKKKKTSAPLEFTLQMNDPVGKVILEMSRHKLVQEQYKQEMPSQFIQQESPPSFQHAQQQFHPHMPPHAIQNMQSQVSPHVRPPVHAPFWALNNNEANRIQQPEQVMQSDPWQMQKSCEEQVHTQLPSRPTASQVIQPQCYVSGKENLHHPVHLQGCESVWARLMHEAGYNSADIDSMASLQGNWKHCNKNANRNIQYIHSPKRKSDCQNSANHDANYTMEIDGRTTWTKFNNQREQLNSGIPDRRLRPFSSQGSNSSTSSINYKNKQMPKIMNSKFRMKPYPPSLLDLDPYWEPRTDNDSQESKGYKVNDFDMSLDEDLQEFFANHENLSVLDSTVPLQSQTNYNKENNRAEPTAKGAKVSHYNEKGKVHNNAPNASSHQLQGTMHVSNNYSLPQPLCDQRQPLIAGINMPNMQPAPPGVDDWNI